MAKATSAAKTKSTPAAKAKSCTDHVLETERRLNIPSGILLSMALVESGQDGEPKPYLLNVGGRTVTAASMNDASRHLRDQKGRVRSDIYVGCMQLSLQHHGNAFRPIERITDPADNVLYAGRYLVRLRAEHGSWSAAVGRYNGGSPQQTRAYQCKVWRHLSQLDPKSGKLIDSGHCVKTDHPDIAPRTRRAFRQSQVASTER